MLNSNWLNVFPFRVLAVWDIKTNITSQIEFSALTLCTKHAKGDICGKKVLRNGSGNVSTL